MTSSSKNRFAAFTLLEILLAMGLCAILAVVAVPSMAGWRSEHRLRTQSDALVRLVQSVKLQAEKDGVAQIVWLLRSGEKPPPETPANVHVFQEEKGAVWTLRRFGQANGGSDIRVIRIDAAGNVEPVAFRVSDGDRHLEMRFDFLTGHAIDEGGAF